MSGLLADAFGHDPSATAAFKALPTVSPREQVKGNLSAVVVGGGTGGPVSIRTLLSMGINTSAVVAMADDGGSTGILRTQAGATAPGDIRKCITAMADDADDPLTKAFKVRFGFAENHTLGNLMLSALEVTSGGFPEAIEICEKLLNARGHVYPSTLNRVTLIAKTRDGRAIEGQAVACHSRTALKRVALDSQSEVQAYEPAVKAIQAADLIVLGPGSLFTSIIPNLLVPGIAEAICSSKAKRVFVCSVADVQGETRNMSALEHFEALNNHGLKGYVDFMIAQDPNVLTQDTSDEDHARLVSLSYADEQAIKESGTKLIVSDLLDSAHPTWHDPAKLRHVFAEVIRRCHLTPM